MNTKKIIAISMAATTAFSMFGAAMSVGAATASADAYVSRTAGDNAVTAATAGTTGTTGTFTVKINGTSQNVSAVTKPISTDVAANSGLKTVIAKYNQFTLFASSLAKSSDKKFADTGVTFKNGYIYAFDYTNNASGQDALEDAVAVASTDLLNAYGEALKYQESTITSGYNADDALAKAEALQKAAETLTTKWVAAFGIGSFTTATSVGAVDMDRISAVGSFNQILAKAIDLDTAKYDPTSFNTEYNADDLIKEIKAAGNNIATATTSDLLYYVQEYNRVIGLLETADPYDYVAQYDELYEKLSERTSADYTEDNWRKFERLLEDAEYKASKATTVSNWKDAVALLKDADGISTVKANVTELKALLKTLYSTDSDFTTAVNSSSLAYAGTKAAGCTYLKTDYEKADGTQTSAWINAFVTSRYATSAYEKAMDVYRKSTKYYGNVAQTDVEKAYDDLVSALDALNATNGPSSWDLLHLEALVEEVGTFMEDDFYTTRTAYKNYIKAYEKAQAVLDKANPGRTEIAAAIENLTDTASATPFGDFVSTAKAIPSALRKTLTLAIRDAKTALDEIKNESGAQYVSLKNAIDAADKVAAGTMATELRSTTRPAFITDFDNAIADLEKAVKGFEQPQGWYQDGGKWFYGEDDSFYVDGWKQIGKTWFYFNADGSAKQNEWLQLDGSWYYFNSNCGAATGWAKVDNKWYFFKGNNAMKTGWEKVDGNWYYMDGSGAMVTGWAQIGGKYYYFAKTSNALGQMAANTTIDGYKLDANGVWVK